MTVIKALKNLSKNHEAVKVRGRICFEFDQNSTDTYDITDVIKSATPNQFEQRRQLEGFTPECDQMNDRFDEDLPSYHSKNNPFTAPFTESGGSTAYTKHVYPAGRTENNRSIVDNDNGRRNSFTEAGQLSTHTLKTGSSGYSQNNLYIDTSAENDHLAIDAKGDRQTSDNGQDHAIGFSSGDIKKEDVRDSDLATKSDKTTDCIGVINIARYTEADQTLYSEPFHMITGDQNLNTTVDCDYSHYSIEKRHLSRCAECDDLAYYVKNGTSKSYPEDNGHGYYSETCPYSEHVDSTGGRGGERETEKNRYTILNYGAVYPRGYDTPIGHVPVPAVHITRYSSTQGQHDQESAIDLRLQNARLRGLTERNEEGVSADLYSVCHGQISSKRDAEGMFLFIKHRSI